MKVDEATNEVGSSYIVVDTGPWIFGKKRMLPAGVIDRVYRGDEKVYVNQSKDEIKDAPEFDDTTSRKDEYRDEVSTTTAARARPIPEVRRTLIPFRSCVVAGRPVTRHRSPCASWNARRRGVIS